MEKIKHFLQSEKGKDILIVFILIFVALISFTLGRMSKNSQNQGFLGQNEVLPTLAGKSLNQGFNEPKNKEESLGNSPIYKGVDLKGREYFASKRGKKYYPFGCSAGKSIKEENRIYFASEAEAKSKGYTISTSCD